MRLFANTYPDQVAAVVLVDACHEDQNFEKDLSSKGFGAQCKDYFFNIVKFTLIQLNYLSFFGFDLLFL